MYTSTSNRYKMPTVTTRVPENMLKEIDTFGKKKHMDRSTMLRNLLAKALDEEKKEDTLQLYKNKKVSLQRMAEILGITYLDALDLIKEEGLYLHYDMEDLKDDMRGWK